jgi:hypothetical protein
MTKQRLFNDFYFKAGIESIIRPDATPRLKIIVLPFFLKLSSSGYHLISLEISGQ